MMSFRILFLFLSVTLTLAYVQFTVSSLALDTGASTHIACSPSSLFRQYVSLTRIFYFYLFFTIPIPHTLFVSFYSILHACALSLSVLQSRGHWSINERSLHKTFCTLCGTVCCITSSSSILFFSFLLSPLRAHITCPRDNTPMTITKSIVREQ